MKLPNLINSEQINQTFKHNFPWKIFSKLKLSVKFSQKLKK